VPPRRFWGEGHTGWRERGWESPNSDEGTYTRVLFIYTYFGVPPMIQVNPWGTVTFYKVLVYSISFIISDKKRPVDAVFSQRRDKLNFHDIPGKKTGLFASKVLKLDPDGVLTSGLDSSGPSKKRLDPSRLPMKDLEQLGCSTPASMVTMDVRSAAIGRRHVFSSSAGPISIRGTEYTRSPDPVLNAEQARSREHARSSENMRRSELVRGSAEHMRSSEYMSSAEQLRSIENGRRVDYLQRPEGHFARQKVSFSVQHI
jgi:hypothetical protein